MKTVNVVAAIIKQGNTILGTQRGYGEFAGGWGLLTDPDGAYSSAWMPTDDSILVPTAGGGVSADTYSAFTALTTGSFPVN